MKFFATIALSCLYTGAIAAPVAAPAGLDGLLGSGLPVGGAGGAGGANVVTDLLKTVTGGLKLGGGSPVGGSPVGGGLPGGIVRRNLDETIKDLVNGLPGGENIPIKGLSLPVGLRRGVLDAGKASNSIVPSTGSGGSPLDTVTDALKGATGGVGGGSSGGLPVLGGLTKGGLPVGGL